MSVVHERDIEEPTPSTSKEKTTSYLRYTLPMGVGSPRVCQAHHGALQPAVLPSILANNSMILGLPENTIGEERLLLATA